MTYVYVIGILQPSILIAIKWVTGFIFILENDHSVTDATGSKNGVFYIRV
jgi:hypothetical protein